MLVGDANPNVRPVSALQVGHQILRPGRTDHAERCRPPAKLRGEPTRQLQVGDSDRMIRVEMRQEQRGHLAEGNL
jgi:hypothetical protein